jgi:hypothetical protein
MTTKLIFLLTLLAYSIIVSQSFMYLLSLKQVQLNLDADAYTALRKLTDTSMRGSLTYVVYAALLASLALVIVTIKNPGGVVFITAVIAFIALVIDTVLTLKGNLPINDVINTWSAGHIPANWMEYRTKWFEIFQYRQMAVITGFVSLLVGVVWRK